MRKLIKTDGTEILLEGLHSTAEIAKLIGADQGMDTVRLDAGMVMFLDDIGHAKGLAINPKATALYLARCRPGTTHTIRGDVAIVPDRDFGPSGRSKGGLW